MATYTTSGSGVRQGYTTTEYVTQPNTTTYTVGGSTYIGAPQLHMQLVLPLLLHMQSVVQLRLHHIMLEVQPLHLHMLWVVQPM